MNSCVGRIIRAEVGNISEAQFGLKLDCHITGTDVVNCTPLFMVDFNDKHFRHAVDAAFVMRDIIWRIRALLEAAKVENVSALVGVPVSISIDNEEVKDVQVLTDMI